MLDHQLTLSLESAGILPIMVSANPLFSSKLGPPIEAFKQLLSGSATVFLSDSFAIFVLDEMFSPVHTLQLRNLYQVIFSGEWRKGILTLVF